MSCQCAARVSAGEPLVTWVPLAPGVLCGVTPLVPEISHVLSRFVYSRRDGAQLVVESPLCAVQLRLHDGRGAQLLSRLSTPQTIQSLHDDAETVAHFTGLLHHVGMLSQVMADTTTLDDTTLPLATWEFHDLLFHSRSRVGRHANPVGGTYRLAGQLEPFPVVQPPMAAHPIRLAVPDLAALAEGDAPLSRVLEARRSLRQHGERPMTAEQLGHFLYRVARVRQRIDTP